MRALRIVPLLVSLAEHFRLLHRGEGFAVQELVPEPAVEALAVGVLPSQRARLNPGHRGIPGRPQPCSQALPLAGRGRGNPPQNPSRPRQTRM